ncbi:GNAT family N-acetyltransferase [Roseiarcaceae bacterium H3SJ34-1]|uniref:GNAT family N-acetyltransferase n=1 Tax=Terripilifer ovatus TaxID=3032367 RepID=UPI003AB91D62|nr:GNAT family N-acetyltransferase [Roseiarcaceae bacterium H3SJ34-1]
MPSDIELAHGPRPGLAEEIVRLHRVYYSREWGLGTAFETIVAAGVADFMPRCEEGNSRILHASREGRLLGSLTLDAGERGTPEACCHLRWFILADAAQGQGIGTALMRQAMAFMDERQIAHCWLTTFAGLAAARKLYENHGFRLTQSVTASTWGRALEEQRFDWLRPL